MRHTAANCNTFDLLQMKRAWMLGAFEHQQQYTPPPPTSIPLFRYKFDECLRYTLVAAVLHHGQGLGRGHYTAVCKAAQQQWVHWDDSSHRLVAEAEALHMCV